jgi:peptide/nickel transport system substrate-binding protein
MDRVLRIAQPRVALQEPHDCTDAKDALAILTALFDPLVAFDPDMRYVPALAEKWRVSDDARTWTFSLRPDAVFHNGRAVDAEAAAYSLRRMARPDMGVTLGAPGVYHQYLDGMEIVCPDRRTVRLTLSHPIADLLDILVTGYILPPEDVDRLGNEFRLTPVGTGPYHYRAHEAGVRVRAEKNPNYFGEVPDFAGIEWVQVPDPDDRVRMVKEGQALIAVGPPYTTAIAVDGVTGLRSQGTTVFILIFNSRRGPLQDARVRRALNLGVDRKALIETVLNGAGYPLNGFISPVHFGCDPRQPIIPFDPDRARALLRESGHGGGLSLTLDSPTSLPNESVRLSEALARQLRRIGVKMDIVYTEDREHYANKVRLKDIHDMCVFDSSPLSTFRVLKEKVDARFAGSWWQGYHNARVEHLLDEAQATPDRDLRRKIYRKCFRLLNEDPPWLYLYAYMHMTCVAPALRGWRLPAHGIIDPRHIGKGGA